ncbi:hypothetical protein BJX62DRAFT_198520 [Aspergillus germanicus]
MTRASIVRKTFSLQNSSCLYFRRWTRNAMLEESWFCFASGCISRPHSCLLWSLLIVTFLTRSRGIYFQGCVKFKPSHESGQILDLKY